MKITMFNTTTNKATGTINLKASTAFKALKAGIIQRDGNRLIKRFITPSQEVFLVPVR